MVATARQRAALAAAALAGIQVHANDHAPKMATNMVESAKLYGNLNKYAYYFTDLLIGSPNPQRTSVIVDTGSRIAGFPCSGCEHCGQHIDAYFDVNRSNTARWLECGAGCTEGCINRQCSYKETYSEGSSIMGRWFDDLVELGDSLNKNPKVHARLGCHTWVDKLFFTQRANGIMGLAPGSDNSLADGSPTVLQDLFRDHAHISTRVFSLCLASWGGRLTVGGYSTWYHEQDVHWTPMRASKYYFIFPNSLALVPAGGSIAGELGSSADTGSVNLTDTDFGVTIVDSGTTYTYFPGPLFQSLVSTLRSYCQGHGGCEAMREGEDCWRLNDASFGPDMFPTIRFHFQGGAHVDWSPQGYLHERGVQGLWCQTFTRNTLYQTVLGISWLLHKDVIFDMTTNRLGIARANCPEHHRGEEERLEAAAQRKFDRAIVQDVPSANSRVSSRVLWLGSGALVAASVALSAATLLRLQRRDALSSLATRLPCEEFNDETLADTEVLE